MVRILKCLSRTLRLVSNVRGRFRLGVLAPLVDAGWHEGRNWELERLEEYLSGFDTVFPPAAGRVLSEFGGLDIGLGGADDHFWLHH
ncbi:SUKH-3 domain-containing protein [Luteolibacter arcticus]|uniref:SUKH-3 domain-containing protein n=1 Tax=Luteolibacter arcticus TaxID=1581411 RepID=UPI0034E092A9